MRRISCLMVLVSLSFIMGCGPDYKPVPYVERDNSNLKPIVCHDAIGHIEGNKPWIMGGNCCCTPTKENYELHIKHGTIDKSVSYEDYLAMYQSKGIATGLDHSGCNNLCKHGPHVTMGGKCMVAPQPGTPNYRVVTYGPHRNLVNPPVTEKKK